jgi:hypothetical protein
VAGEAHVLKPQEICAFELRGLGPECGGGSTPAVDDVWSPNLMTLGHPLWLSLPGLQYEYMEVKRAVLEAGSYQAYLEQLAARRRSLHEAQMAPAGEGGKASHMQSPDEHDRRRGLLVSLITFTPIRQAPRKAGISLSSSLIAAGLASLVAWAFQTGLIRLQFGGPP